MSRQAATRNKSRRFLVQALYQAQISQTEISEVICPFIQDHNMKRADIVFFRSVLEGIGSDFSSLVNLIDQIGNRSFEDSDPVERSILLIGSFELRSKNDVPYRVVINECVELAKYFGASESFKYINSVLDSLSEILRPAEYAAE